MKKVVEAAVKRVAKTNDHWFGFTPTSGLLLVLVQLKAAANVIQLENMMDASIEINGEKAILHYLVNEAFEKIEGELLKRIGAEVTDDGEVVLATYEADDAGVETSHRQMPTISLEWTGDTSMKITFPVERD